MAKRVRECWIAEHNGIIYGAGSSSRSAWKMAKQWIDPDSSTEGFEFRPATNSLCRFVRKLGEQSGRISWPASSGRPKVGLKRRSRR